MRVPTAGPEDMSERPVTTPTRPPHSENIHGRRAPGDSRCILVLGVHGSGTSAVAGVLHRLGVSLGDRLVGPTRHNPRGHYEDADFRVLLYSYRSDRSLLPTILAFLETRFERRALWGLKEPAILEAINDLGGYLATRTYRIIATDRDPLACVRSYLWKWPLAKPADVVQLHDELRARRESFLQRHRPPTLWARYNDLTARPAVGVRSIVEFVFAGRLAPPLDAVRRAVDFIDPGLNNHRELSGD
jgi:hypothetical protein